MEEYNWDDREEFVEDMIGMLEQGSSNDVKIVLKDGEIFANLDILRRRSEYFRMMFASTFEEGNTKTVNLSQWSKVSMEKIVREAFDRKKHRLFNDIDQNNLKLHPP